MRAITRSLFGAASAVIAVGALSACSPADETPSVDGLKIVTTTTQLTDFTNNITEGTDAEVVSLFESGQSVHSFEATAADLEDIRTADVVVYNGMGLEPWLEETLKSAGFDGTKIDASAGFDPNSIHDDHDHGDDGHDHGDDGHDHDDDGHDHDDHAAAGTDERIAAGVYRHDDHEHGGNDDDHDDHGDDHDDHGHDDDDHGDHDDHGHGGHGHDHDHDHDGPNPHIWTSPDGAVSMVETVANELGKADNAHADEYEENAEGYIAKLGKLDQWIGENMKQVPEKERVVATGHDALGYYNDEYHITFVGSIMPSWDDNAEPSAAELDKLIADIKKHKVPAIFSETQLDPATAEALANEAGIKVYSGEDGLYTDSLGAAGSDADTYIKATVHNTKQLLDSWGKTASEIPAEIQDA